MFTQHYVFVRDCVVCDERVDLVEDRPSVVIGSSRAGEVHMERIFSSRKTPTQFHSPPKFHFQNPVHDYEFPGMWFRILTWDQFLWLSRRSAAGSADSSASSLRWENWSNRKQIGNEGASQSSKEGGAAKGRAL
jgi:hypothetical protein